MAGWRRAIELAIGEEEFGSVARDCALANGTGEPGRRARMLLAYRENPSFFAVGRAVGVHHQTVQRCVERALACGPMRRSTTCRGPARSRRSPPRPRHGLRISPVARPRNSAIRTNCGRRDFSPAMHVSMGRRRGTPALPSWLRARCATSSTSRR